MQSALSRHIQKCHKEEEEVKAALKLPGPEKQQAFKNMKRQGIYQFNVKALCNQSEEELIKERKTAQHKSYTQMAMCSLCKAFLNKNTMHRHKKICKRAEETTIPPCGISLNVFKEVEYPASYVQFVYTRIQTDDVGMKIRDDTFIKDYGFMEYQAIEGSSFKLTEKLNTLRSKMRRLARLFMEFQKIASEAGVVVKHCSEMFNVKSIKLLSTAVNSMTIDPEGEMKSGLRLGLRSLILEVSNSIYSTHMVMGEDDKALEAEKFRKVLQVRWKSFFRSAQEAIIKKRQNESRDPKRLPSVEDIKQIQQFTKSSVKELVSDAAYSLMTQTLFCKLRNFIASRLTLFNARRGGEATRLTVSELKDAFKDKWVDESFIKKGTESDDFEKMACKLKCAYLHSSKKSELVPVIIPEDCWKGLQMLTDVENRKLAGIHPQNEFVFANTEDSVDHVSGWQCVHDVCEKADVPRNITATDMRHFVATHYASLEVPQQERDFFIQKHMGHSKFINENVYQCPPAVREIKMAGKFLMTLDSYEGKYDKVLE